MSEAPQQKFRPLAPAWHTVAVLAVIGISAYNGMQRAAQLRGTGNPYRMTIYLHTIRFEWLMLALVLFGLWRGRSSVFEVLGERWRSVRQFLLDAGIGILLLVVTIVVSSIAGGHTSGKDPAVQFLLPQSGREIAMWVLLSFSAGVCEEAVYRGYLQKQFMAWTGSAAAGIVLSGIVVWRSAHLSGIRACGGDRVDRSHGWRCGPLATQRASGNDCTHAAGCTGRIVESLASAASVHST